MTGAELPRRAAILGAGTIGASVGALLALYGISVTLVVRRQPAAEEGLSAVGARLGRLAELGAVDAARSEGAMQRVSTSVGIPDGPPFDLIFEAIREDRDDKRSLLSAAESALADDGVMTSTTSSIQIETLGSALRRAARFAGWHWFHPADLMPLVEVIPAGDTSGETVGTLERWSRALGKEPVVLQRDVPGFVANRLQYALLREAYGLVEEGVCRFADVETAITAGLGIRWAALGPFGSMDLAGLDVHSEVCRALFPQLRAGTAVPTALSELRRSGARGAKGGRGILGDYPPARIAAVEELRDRTIIELRGRDTRGA